MEDILVWPILLYGGWLAIVGVAIIAALILASVRSAHREITCSAENNGCSEPNKLLEVFACWVLYFIPFFVMFFVLLAANTDLASALLSAAVTGTFTAIILTLQRLIKTRARPALMAQVVTVRHP